MNGVVEAANKNITKNLGKDDRHIQGLARVLTICSMRISHFCSYFHRCDLVFIGIWHGGRPPRKGRDPISQDFISDKAIRS